MQSGINYHCENINRLSEPMNISSRHHFQRYSYEQATSSGQVSAKSENKQHHSPIFQEANVNTRSTNVYCFGTELTALAETAGVL